MREDISLAIIQSVVDSQKDLIIIFYNDEPILINSAFEKFFSVLSLEQYKSEFGSFVNNFVPHPSYFHADKINGSSSWFDAVLELPEIERVVSMMTPNYEPHAFSVGINKVEEYIIVVFTDITQTLIKRIMIENRANIDAKSGAYARNYFLQIAQSYQEAAAFNEKIMSAVLIQVSKKDGSTLRDDESALKALATRFKSITRQDDMLIRWSDDAFLLIYLVDTVKNAQIMLEKLDAISKSAEIKGVEYDFTLIVQNDGESIKTFIKRVGS